MVHKRKERRDELFRRALGLMRMYLPAICFYAWQVCGELACHAPCACTVHAPVHFMRRPVPAQVATPRLRAHVQCNTSVLVSF